MNDERWLPIVGFEGFYEVSDLGRIRSLERTILRRNGHVMTIKPRILKQSNSGGYRVVNLSKGGKMSLQKVHRLVAIAFIPTSDLELFVCHNDGNPANNRVSNLRWDDAAGNARDMQVHGTHFSPNRGAAACKRGHEFTVENTRYTKSGYRRCRECSNMRARKRRRGGLG